MARLPTLFFDVGGVLLTNGWDTGARKRAAETFGLDYPEFQTRHEMLKTAFETGRLSLDAYVKKAVFHRERRSRPRTSSEFMFDQSQPLGDTLEWVRSLARSGQCRLFTLNNESRELHENRVRDLRPRHDLPGLPDLVLPRARPSPTRGSTSAPWGSPRATGGDAIFIDDRALNVEPALALGLNAVQFQGLDPLRDFLGRGIVA